jgi:hypothetical protein
MWREPFFKAMRWYFIALGMAIGSTAFMIAEETGSMTPVGFGILGYGYAYVSATVWRELKGRLLAWAICVYFGITIISPYVGDALYVLLIFDGEINKYVLWMALLTIIGIPVMAIVFRRMR